MALGLGGTFEPPGLGADGIGGFPGALGAPGFAAMGGAGALGFDANGGGGLPPALGPRECAELFELLADTAGAFFHGVGPPFEAAIPGKTDTGFADEFAAIL